MFHAENIEHVKTYTTQYLSTQDFSLNGAKVDTLKQPHTVHIVFLIDTRTGKVIDAQPSIRFTFTKPLSLQQLQKRFYGDLVLARMVRLKSYESDVQHSLGVTALEITFRDLRNFNLEWACNGFVMETEVRLGYGNSQVVTYEAGSGLDPFVDRKGNPRDRAFRSEDTIIDPEEGPKCEEEKSGACVFLKD